MKQLFLLLMFVLAPVLSDAADNVPLATINERHRVLLKQHCQKCHGAETAEAKFRVDVLPLGITSVETAERWQKVLNALNLKEPPSEDEPQLDKAARPDRLHVHDIHATALALLGLDHTKVIHMHKGQPERVDLNEGRVFKEIAS